MNKLITSIDIGTSKIVCLIAQLNKNGKLCIKSASIQESIGIDKGNIIDIKNASEAIIKAVAKAEKLVGSNIEKVDINIGGDLLKSAIIKANTNFKSNKQITKKNVFTLIDKIKNNLVSNKKYAIHMFPISFAIDNMLTNNPLEMSGKSINLDLHTFFADELKIKNIENCFKKIPLNVGKIIFEGFASPAAVLNDKDKEIGTLVIDIGAGITSYSLIYESKFLFGNSILIAGNSITNDISDILKIPFNIAEKIKIMNTNFYFDDIEENELIKIDIVNNDENIFNIASTKKGKINDIFKARIDDIIKIIFTNLKNKNLIYKVNNIVITGGSAKAFGIEKYINSVTNIPTKVGIPEDFYISSLINMNEIRDPSYATSIGILNYVNKIYQQSIIEDYQNNKTNIIDKTINFLINLFVS